MLLLYDVPPTIYDKTTRRIKILVQFLFCSTISLIYVKQNYKHFLYTKIYLHINKMM